MMTKNIARPIKTIIEAGITEKIVKLFQYARIILKRFMRNNAHNY